jgi:succinyl-diaminopimelate desuccinylase
MGLIYKVLFPSISTFEPPPVHGPFPRGMAQVDEHVEIEEYLHIVRMHVLSAFDDLSR